MYTSTIALAIAPLLYLARADVGLDRDDIPRECDTICDPIVQLTRTCDTDLRGDRDRDEDRLEVQCVCTNDSFNVGRVAALCADCIHQNAPRDNDDDDDDDDDDNRNDDTKDIDDILYTCGFSSTTYVASAASAAVSGVSVDASRPTDASQLTTTIVGTGTRGSGSNPTATSGSNSNNNNDNNDNNDDNNSDSATATNDSSSPDETNAAAALAPFGLAGAVVGAAMLLA
ncbi:hypothetical protein FSARC_2076 [Fusarium sarcochroum]|uniref:Protein CAP22 n=1 Tax=Fusarium sarcochroum TaxID=1208366 RepID=A0A8H4U7M6_9HYPO|nr:hypothetical protein FSARC_2076 [Fusarium sarcochroum]